MNPTPHEYKFRNLTSGYKVLHVHSLTINIYDISLSKPTKRENQPHNNCFNIDLFCLLSKNYCLTSICFVLLSKNYCLTSIQCLALISSLQHTSIQNPRTLNPNSRTLIPNSKNLIPKSQDYSLQFIPIPPSPSPAVFSTGHHYSGSTAPPNRIRLLRH